MARQGSQAPGYATGVTFSGFTALGLPDQGGVLFLGTLNANSAAKITSTNDVGIWQVGTDGTLKLVVAEGQMLNGKTITGLTFLPTLAYVNGQTRSFVQTSGDLVFGATFSDKSTGIFKVVDGTSETVALSGEAATGVAGATYSAFGNAAINANDDTAFAATLATNAAGGVTTANNVGIWADDTVSPQDLIARTGMAAPGTTGTFLTLSDPVYNNNDAAAFRGTLKVVTGEATSTTAAGLWSNSSGTLTLVARQGSQAPGCPAGATFSAFTELALPDQGGIVFLATLNTSTTAGVASTTNQGIWAVDTNGNLQLIVREGDTINGKTVTALKFLPSLLYVGGQSRSFAQGTGDLVYEATFSDKSSGIFSVTFP